MRDSHRMAPSSSRITLNKRAISSILVAIALFIFLSLSFSSSSSSPSSQVSSSDEPPSTTTTTTTISDEDGNIHPAVQDVAHVSQEILKGDAIAGKIENATAKAELGRAAWKVLHTTMAKFPDRPSHDEQTALFSYIHLFARLYPCGECAAHFRQILTKFPPQVSTRSNAAAWACHVHNEVNKSLDKTLFDCSKIGDFYDCGCADEDDKGGKAKGKEEKEVRAAAKESEKIDLVVEKNGPTRGG